MVVEQGMGESLRDVVFHEDAGGMMIDRMVHEKVYSEDTAKVIDGEVKTLINEASKRADLVIRANREPLERLAKALLSKETIDGDEVIELLKDAKLPKGAEL